MGAHQKPNPGFGRWIRENRLRQGHSQQHIADCVQGLTQPDLSIIERRGRIPEQDVLSRLCEFLGLSIEEAHQQISASGLVELLRRRCVASQICFSRLIQQYAEKPDGARLCIIRDSHQPCDAMRLSLFSRLLELHDGLAVSILFTHADVMFERSFRRFHGTLGVTNPASHRVHGHVCQQSDFELNGPPMLQPVVLLVSADSCEPVTWHYVPEILESLPDKPPESADSLQMACEPANPLGKSIADYIGFWGATALDADRWKQIAV